MAAQLESAEVAAALVTRRAADLRQRTHAMRTELGSWRRELEGLEDAARGEQVAMRECEREAAVLGEQLRARVDAGASFREQGERRVRSFEDALERLGDMERRRSVRRLEARLRDARARGKLEGAREGRQDLDAAQDESSTAVQDA